MKALGEGDTRCLNISVQTLLYLTYGRSAILSKWIFTQCIVGAIVLPRHVEISRDQKYLESLIESESVNKVLSD